jgi:hypothetical protein
MLQKILKYDPIPPLLSSQNEDLIYFVRRDLMNEAVQPISYIWSLPYVQKIIKKQQPDGSWKYPGKQMVVFPKYHYSLVETWKQFRYLVDQYELTKKYEPIRKAAEFLFSCQTDAGDIRGMIGNQYATYYTGAIMSLLIKAGFEKDPRIEKGFQWLISMRQNDGGWTIPLLTRYEKLGMEEVNKLTSQPADPIEPDRTRPFSHHWTGMVIRAFAAHPIYRKSESAMVAANLLKTRFFKKDIYTSYQDADHWLRFQFPFWWNNLVSALDSISWIGLSKDDPDIREALDWFIAHQQADGLWKLSYSKKHRNSVNSKTYEMQLWVNLAICRIFKRFFG